MRDYKKYMRSFPEMDKQGRITRSFYFSIGKTLLSPACVELGEILRDAWNYRKSTELYSRAINNAAIHIGMKEAPDYTSRLTLESDCSCFLPGPVWSLKRDPLIQEREVGFVIHSNAKRIVEKLCKEKGWGKPGFYRWAIERYLLYWSGRELTSYDLGNYVQKTRKWRNK